MQPKDIFDAINKVRQNPNIVISEIKQQLKRFQSNNVFRNRSNIRIRSISGKASFQQAILAIQRQKPKTNLLWNPFLAQAAQQYKQIMQNDKNINPFQIIKSICTYKGNISFSINQSDANDDIIELVAAMVVGDDDQKKTVRTAIFHPLNKQFGCSVKQIGNKNIVYTIFAQNISGNPLSYPTHSPQQKSPTQTWANSTITKFFSTQKQITKQHQYIKKGKQLLVQLNKIRTQPKQYILTIKSQISKFKDQKIINTQFGLLNTKQGQVPYYELITQLQNQYPLPILKEVSSLTIVALQQILQGEVLLQNKTSFQSLLDKYCSNTQNVKSFKQTNIEDSVSIILMRLLVGDGDKKRTVRKKLLSPICRAIGCAISNDTVVINAGDSARDNPQVVQQYMQYIKDRTKSKFHKKQQLDNDTKINNKNSGKQKIVVKKTSKSHNQKKAGRTYKITEIQVTYDNGEIQDIVQEELVN